MRNFRVKRLFSKHLILEEFKNVYFGSKARSLLKEGTRMANKCAQVTLGPGGRNALLEYEPGLPKITKDGVTVVKNVYMNDRTSEIGASYIRKVASNTNMICGDGTTTSVMLSCAIFEKGERLLHTGINPIKLKRGMEKARDQILEYLDEIAEPLIEEKDILNVARVDFFFC